MRDFRVSPTELDRRHADRADAERRYNDALTAVDSALPAAPGELRASREVELPHASPPTPTRILHEAPPGGPGWRGRLVRFVWRTVGPVLTRQQAVNEGLVARVDRTDAALRHLAEALQERDRADRRQEAALRTFESRLVQFLQQITPFVDTKLRVIEAALEELRLTATSAQRTAVAAKRHIERQGAAGSGDTPPDPGSPFPAVQPSALRPDTSGGAAYVGFEDIFRGSPDAIRARQQDYAQRFAGAADVLDVGCGRGEFLDLLRERGITARGIDANPEMVEVCRARGLDATFGDANAYLGALPDGSLGGLIAAQVVEHLEPAYLMRFLATAHAKLRPGSPIVLETINVACWLAFFESYIRDITHVRPLHPDTLRYLVVAAGFEQVDVEFRSAIDPEGRLQRLSGADLPPPLSSLVQTLNANVDRLNERLFTDLDYAVTAVRGH